MSARAPVENKGFVDELSCTSLIVNAPLGRATSGALCIWGITFENLFNALVRVRTKDVECLYDSSPSIRARRRVFDRALDREEDENPDWKDNS